jgi:hypothetical protein
MGCAAAPGGSTRERKFQSFRPLFHVAKHIKIQIETGDMTMIYSRTLLGLAMLGVLHVSIHPAWAAFIGNIQGGADFPAGAVSFADAVADFSPVIKSNQPNPQYLEATKALGLPDYVGNDASAITYASLGDGGSITLRFIDNYLTGSNSPEPDLFIFEVGPDVEDTFVEISKNGLDFFPVGKVGGSFSTIDIDAFGYRTADEFAYVRLTDDPSLDDQTGVTVGADIDAVGAISTVAVPEPATLAMLTMLIPLVLRRRRCLDLANL